jgi:hypothetical protein
VDGHGRMVVERRVRAQGQLAQSLGDVHSTIREGLSLTFTRMELRLGPLGIPGTECEAVAGEKVRNQKEN